MNIKGHLCLKVIINNENKFNIIKYNNNYIIAKKVLIITSAIICLFVCLCFIFKQIKFVCMYVYIALSDCYCKEEEENEI